LNELENKIRLLIGKDMIPYDGVVVEPKEKVSLYPYSIQLSSCRSRDSAYEVFRNYQKDGLIPYIVQEDLGKDEVWWRVFVGHYKTRKEALRAKKEYDLSASIVKKTPYSNLINVFSSEIEAKDNLSRLQHLGYSTYIVRSDEKTFRLVEGAFATRQKAIKHKLALQSKGIENQVVKR
jgi:cell division septation protein DedD